jgi:hypothetical protein
MRVKVNEKGAAAGDLGDCDAAYLAATADMALKAPDRAAIKQYLAKGGFLWIEAVGGRRAAEEAVKTLARDAGWELTPLAKDEALIVGRFAKAHGYDLSSGVRYGRALRIARISSQYAELSGIHQDGKLVGIYSPFDVVFSTTGYAAYGCRGYEPEDALAVATNIILYLTDRNTTK